MAKSPPLPSLLEGNSSSVSVEKPMEHGVFVKFYSKLTIVFRNKDYLPYLVTAGIVPPDNIHYLSNLSSRDRPMRILEYISDSLDDGDKQLFYEMLEIMKGHGNNHAQSLAEEINKAVVNGVDFRIAKINSFESVGSTRSDSIGSVTRSDSLRSGSVRSDSMGSIATSIGKVEKPMEHGVFVKFCSKLTIVFRNKDYLPYLVTAGIVPPDNFHYLSNLSNRDRPMRILEYISDSLDDGDKQLFYEMLEIMKGHGNNHAQNLAEEINKAVVSGVDFRIAKINSFGSVGSTRSDSIGSVTRSDSLRSGSVRSDSMGSIATSIGKEAINQDVIKWMVEARRTGNVIKVRYGKVLFSGSCYTGKTSFFHLLMKDKLEDRYKSTGLADAHRVIFTTKVCIQPSASDEDVKFKVLNLKNEISQLRSYVHTKVNNAVSCPSTTHDSTVEAESITDIENDIASNSETDQIPEQSTENIWDILTFVDTGGQPEYISMLPAVNSSVMITFVVHKMEGGAASLYRPVTVQHSGKCCFQPYSLGYNNLDLIKTLISFTNNIFLLKKPFLDEVCCKEGNSVSYLSFVGTYLDKVSENDIIEIDKVLAKTVLHSELKYVLKVNPDHQYLVPVDNTTAGQADEDKSASKIRNKIYRLLQEQAVYEVPYVWLLLELEIRKVCEERRCGFITYTEVLDLCKRKELSDDEDFIKNGLRFHHLFGVLLYFDEVKGMRDLIITDHKWLFNKLTDIVLHSYNTDLTNNDDCYKFEHQGIFNKTLLDKIDLATEFKESEIDIETFDVEGSFLNLLQHLKIVSPIENSTKYFMPCLLYNCNFAEDQWKTLQSYGTNCVVTVDNPNLPIEPLAIQFTLCSSPKKAGSFPRGVFCCLVVQLQQDHQNWELQWSCDIKKVFSNLVTFFVEDRSCGHFVTLIDRLFFLKVQIAHDTKIAYGSTIHHEIFCNVRDALHKVGKSLDFCKFNLSYGFVCHNCKKSEHADVKESEKSEVHITKLSKMNSTYLRCYCNQPTKVTLSHKIWFDDVSTITGDIDISGSKKSLEAAYTIQGPASTTMDSVDFSQNEILQQEPAIGDLFEFVVPQINAHWEDVAFTALRYDIPTVEGIQAKHLNNVKKCCQEMFKIWLTTSHGVKPKTWSTLLTQLKKVEELVAVTEVIEKRLMK